MENINIYDELKALRDELNDMKKFYSEFADVVKWVKENEPKLVNKLNKEKLDLQTDIEGCWTINEVLLQYGISKKTFWMYRKNIELFKQNELKEEGKIGRFKQFKKKNIIEFMQQVKELKSENPELFKPEYFKNAS